jgi:cell division FtsZ-interacting protein ZapD
MKKLLPVLIFVAALLLTAAPAFAMEECEHHGTTVESLHHCVMHAYDMGHITSAGVETSLLAKLDAAQAALDRGQPNVAIKQLNAFVAEVNAQSGVTIDAEHAGHLVMHAENVIAALRG